MATFPTHDARMPPSVDLRPLTAADAHWDADGLARLLLDGVRSGASIGFLASLTQADALRYWRDLQPRLGRSAALWIAQVEGEVIGFVQLGYCDRETERHRASVDRWLVRSDWRERGVGGALIGALERQAHEEKRSLLVIDVADGSSADIALQRRGWTRAGVVPGHIASADGSLQDGVRLYRSLWERIPAARADRRG